MSEAGQDPQSRLDDHLRVALRDFIQPTDRATTMRAVRRRVALHRRRVRAGVMAAVVVVVATTTSVVVLAAGSGDGARSTVATAPRQPVSTLRPTSPVPGHVPSSTSSPGTRRAISVPPLTPPPCPPVTNTPSMNGGRYCGPTPSAGNGSGPDGECTPSDTAPPCGRGVVVGRYYAYTLPGTCDGLIIFDGRQWVSELPPSTPEPPMHVWMAMSANGQVGFIGPVGAVGFEPYTGQALNACQAR